MMLLLPPLGFVRSDRPPISWLDWLKGGSSNIRCPECRWRPEKDSRWSCEPGCGHCWNTFDTGGVCPGCDKRWHRTACLRCAAWSAHVAWYERQ
jgi:hypothetical protein